MSDAKVCAVCESGSSGALVTTVCGLHACARCARRVVPHLEAYRRDVEARMAPYGWHVAYAPGGDVAADDEASLAVRDAGSSLPVLCCSKGDVVVHTRLDRAALLAVVSRCGADACVRERRTHKRHGGGGSCRGTKHGNSPPCTST